MSDDVRSTAVPPRKEDVESYYIALGEFITSFANVEAQLRWLCALHSGISVDVTGLVFGDLTAAAAVTTLKRLRKATKRPDDPDLKRALDHLLTISDTRNAILHRGVNFFPDGFMTVQGMPNSRLSPRLVSPETLLSMLRDLSTISGALMIATPADGDAIDMWKKNIRPLAQRPWQYMPAQ